MYDWICRASGWLRWLQPDDARIAAFIVPWWERPPLEPEEEDFEDEETRFLIAQADWIEGAQAEVWQPRVA